jgi:hypothetical protein
MRESILTLVATTGDQALMGSPPGFAVPIERARIPTFSATNGVDGRVGFLHPTPYGSAPQNEYQRRKRGTILAVLDQYTPTRSPAELQMYGPPRPV